MRLTLRTLLAYLDDILDPTQAREIGQKIEESSVAKALVEQIREVMRRRRLTAPDVAPGREGLDPNKVAEYLDNTLQPAEIADIEKICLESDVQLAEVAACHQILTLVLGEPVDVPPHSRERMYSLTATMPSAATTPSGGAPQLAAASSNGAKSETDAEQNATPSAATISPIATAPMGGIADEQQWTGGQTADAGLNESSDDAFRRTIPDYLKPTPLWRRVFPTVAIVVVLLGWLGLFALAPSFSPSNLMQTVTDDSTADSTAREMVPQGNFEPDPSNGRPENRPEPGGEAQLAAAADAFRQVDGGESPGGKPPFKPPVGLDPQPPADEPESATLPSTVAAKSTRPLETGTAAVPAVTPTPAESTSSAATKPAAAESQPGPPDPDSKPIAEPSAPAAEKIPALAANYVSADAVLLRKDKESDKWYLQPRQTPIVAGVWYACPAPYDAQLEIPERNVQATLLGRTRARYLGPSAAGDFGFQIAQGKVVLQLKDPGNIDEGTVLALSTGEDLWRVELLTPETACGVEIQPVPPGQFEQPPQPDSYQGGLYVRAGTVRFSDAQGSVRVINAGEWMPLTPSVRAADELGTSVTKFPGGYPGWLAADRQPTRTERRYAALFEREFDADQTVTLSIGPIVDHPDPTLSHYATECLAVTADYQPLISAIGNLDHEESRKAAIQGLRVWLPQAPEHAEQLRTELRKRYPSDDVPVLYELLWGYSEDDLKVPAKSQQLVDWLDHSNVAVRELVIRHLEKFTGRTMDFRANASAASRRVSIRRWRDHISRTGILVE